LRPQRPKHDHPRHGDLRIRPNRPGPNRTRTLELNGVSPKPKRSGRPPPVPPGSRTQCDTSHLVPVSDQVGPITRNIEWIQATATAPRATTRASPGTQK